MQKNCLILLSLFLAVGCSYKPIIDSKGRSGKWNEARATEITDDLQSCKYQAKQHTNTINEAGKKVYNVLIRPKLLWLSPKARDEYKAIQVNCLEGRGHNVLNK